MMHKWAHSREEAAHHQLPIAMALNHLNNFYGGMFELHTKLDALLAHFK